MNRFDTFCNLILEVYGKRSDVPLDGRSAPDRYNNPGGAYPKQSFEKFGMEGYGVIGGGHPIAKYPDLASGIAANIEHLRSMPIVGKTVGEARYYWVNGSFGGSKSISGMNSDQVITAEMLTDPNWLSQWMKGTAQDEGFGQSGRQIDDNSFSQAITMLQNKSNFSPSAQYASTGTSEQPSSDGNAQGETSQTASTFASFTNPLKTDFSKTAALGALQNVLGFTRSAIEKTTGKKMPDIYGNTVASTKNNKTAVSDTDAFLGKGKWATTDKDEKEVKDFLGEV